MTEFMGLYRDLILGLAKLSGLFTDSETPLIPYRAVERAYCATHHAKDISRGDNSFDAIIQKTSAGVGIKTFRATNAKSKKLEKIAEFSNVETAAKLDLLSGLSLAKEVAKLRNLRINSHSLENKIDLSKSIYHCVVRTPKSLFIHEEPYELIDEKRISLIKLSGKSSARSVRFQDGRHTYSFHKGKHTLFKVFDLKKHENSSREEIEINTNIIELVLGHSTGVTNLLYMETKPSYETVVLPLYSPRTGKVEPKSGLNMWLAAGRPRKFGEGYIPIPGEVRKLKPTFFPPRDSKFLLKLPSENQEISVKTCQDQGKALMSTDDNRLLLTWLYNIIDGDSLGSVKRFKSKSPYTYDDLARIGFDSVVVKKIDANHFELTLGEIGSFEEFLDSLVVEQD